ncbi:VWA domain-containing protein [bacterium]|nr:VWA domain-containing protein [bacterium]
MILHDPYWLLLLLLIPVILWDALKLTGKAGVRYSDISLLKRIKPTLAVRLRPFIVLLRVAAVALLAIALARPQKGKEDTKVTTEGIDIMLTIDTSGSMIAEDLAKDRSRLDVVKEVTADFIKHRSSDRIGLVVYGADAYTQCPLTLDYGTLLTLLDQCEIGMADQSATAIGDALATALLRLKDSSVTSRVVVLLTDGMNNAGKMAPMAVAQSAKALGVKIYTIGAGTRGMAPVPGTDFFGRKILQQVPVEIDEDLLKGIAKTTGGQYFRATEKASLEKIYKEIDQLEKTKTESLTYMEWIERFPGLAFAAAALLIIETLLLATRFQKLP